MYEEKYEQAIFYIKELYPEYEKVKFDITNGELGYIHGLIYVENLKELQIIVNKFLGQKVYRVEFLKVVEVYGRDEEEARLFSEEFKPNKSFVNRIVESTNNIAFNV
jgi:putative heme iron utilization protein